MLYRTTNEGDIERSVLFRLQIEQPKPIIGEHNIERAQACTKRITRKKIKGVELTTTYCSRARYYPMLLLLQILLNINNI